jgi:hypothetical protein
LPNLPDCSDLAVFRNTGWLKFDTDPGLLAWLKTAGPAALATRDDPEFAEWLTCEGTWFVGVNALGNDNKGAVAGSGPLRGRAIEFARDNLGFGAADLDRAQVSICYPGFPKPRPGETAKAFEYRLNRDGAHVDGLHPFGPTRRRKLLEFQGFLLGIPITKADSLAAPLVVWEGSHKIMAEMFRAALTEVSPEQWPDIDLTEAYHAARQEVFNSCKRRVIHACPGQAYLLHRMALHGVSPWQSNAVASTDGRAIAYFRPEIPREKWL